MSARRSVGIYRWQASTPIGKVEAALAWQVIEPQERRHQFAIGHPLSTAVRSFSTVAAPIAFGVAARLAHTALNRARRERPALHGPLPALGPGTPTTPR